MIAITGSDGFLGCNLTQRLNKENIKYEVFDLKKHNLLEVSSLESFVKNKETIIHLAGAPRNANTAEFISTNVTGTLNLLEAIKLYGPKNSKIIMPSTVHVYAPTKELYSYREEDKTFCSGIGGLSKLMAEEAIKHYSSKFGIKYVILRLTNTYGPYCKPFGNSAIATILHCAKKDLTFPLEGGGIQERDYIHVDDVIDAFLKAVTFDQNETFNISSGKHITILELIEKTQNLINKKIPVQKMGEGIKDYLLMSSEKTNRLLKWKSNISLSEGLKRTYGE